MLEHLHPAFVCWFGTKFAAPTAPQLAAWPLVASGQHALIGAPTGSRKTLTALSNDIQRRVQIG
jgi:ATP-dependent helicase Lhr and Lhr-like helicase